MSVRRSTFSHPTRGAPSKSVHHIGENAIHHNIVVDAQSYEIGDKVSIFSSSNKSWHEDGVIVDIDRRGQLKIAYNKVKNRLLQSKWLSPDNAVGSLKKRLDENICTSKTIAQLIRQQITYLDSLIERRQGEMKSLAEEVVKARQQKGVLAQELAKIEGGEAVAREMTRMGNVHLEDIIEHKEAKSLQPIEKGHSVARLAESMIFALRWSIMRVTSVPSKLRGGDFNECIDAHFPEKGSGSPYHTPAHRLGDFTFKDYGPKIFKRIRAELSGVNELEYLEMIAHNQKFLEFISNSRSGAFFFFSSNGRFMIKTISKVECDFLRQNLKKYYFHLMEHKDTMLAKVYGLHRIKIHGVSLKFVVMESIFYSGNPKYIHQIFDLKGSRGQTRMATAKDFERAPTENFTSTVLKDNDFIEREISIKVGKEEAAKFRKILENDIKFLKKLKVIDYSLLVGLHHTDKKVPQATKNQPFRLSHTLGGDWKNGVHLSVPPSLMRAGSSDVVLARDNDESLSSPQSRSPSSAAPSPRSATMPSQSPERKAASAGERSLSASEHGATDERSNNQKKTSSRSLAEMRNVWSSEDGKTIYYIGVIDILIQYGMKKKMEHTYKTSVLGGSESDVSVIPPDRYAKRFLDFLMPRIM